MTNREYLMTKLAEMSDEALMKHLGSFGDLFLCLDTWNQPMFNCDRQCPYKGDCGRRHEFLSRRTSPKSKGKIDYWVGMI